MLYWHRSCHSNAMTPLRFLLALMFLCTRGFSRVRREVSALAARVTIKTWQKPETALEKSLAPRVAISRNETGILRLLWLKSFIYSRNKWRILHGRRETRNFSSSVEKHFTSERSFRTVMMNLKLQNAARRRFVLFKCYVIKLLSGVAWPLRFWIIYE